MNFKEFSDGVKTEIGADANRMGAEGSIERFIRTAAIALQQTHPAFECFESVRIAYDDVIEDGLAGFAQGVAFRPIDKVTRVDTDLDDDPSRCDERPVRRYEWDKRSDLVKGRVISGNLYFAQSPDFAHVVIFPMLTEKQHLIYEYRTVRREFDDETPMPFPEEAIAVAADWVRSKIAYNLDRDIPEGDRYLALYRNGRRILYSNTNK